MLDIFSFVLIILFLTINIRSGTPQCSVPSLFLFNFYIHEIAKLKHVSIALFANGTTIYAQYDETRSQKPNPT